MGNNIVSLDNLALIVAHLNEEIKYKMGEHTEAPVTEDTLCIMSNGDNVSLIFCGFNIWDSLTEQEFENIPLRAQMELNERENFEAHIRLLINDKINILKNLEV